jgi:SAM-dependent methyltransferase
MPDADGALDATRKRFEGWLDEHGAESPQAVGWNDVEAQELRFEILAQVMEGDGPVSVADFGCGPGALFAHLATRSDPPPLGAYIGYDIVPAFVDVARAEHTDPRARFEVGSEVGEDVDYVLASGALTVRPGITDAEWEAHVQARLGRLWERSRRGLAFNMLTRQSQPSPDDIYIGDPETWARWCSRTLPGALVALRWGPPLPDFTVLVRRQPA